MVELFLPGGKTTCPKCIKSISILYVRIHAQYLVLYIHTLQQFETHVIYSNVLYIQISKANQRVYGSRGEK